MNTDSGLNWFGAIVTIVSILYAVFRIWQSYLPSNVMKDLEALLEETDSLFRNAQEEGLLLDPAFIDDTMRKLARLRDSCVVVRGDVHTASTSPWQEYLAVFLGLTGKVTVIYADVKKLRANISQSSAEAKLKLQEERRAADAESNGAASINLAMMSAALPFPACTEDRVENKRARSNSIRSISSDDSEATAVDQEEVGPSKDVSPTASSGLRSSVHRVIASVLYVPKRLLGPRPAVDSVS